MINILSESDRTVVENLTSNQQLKKIIKMMCFLFICA